jgi:hypothetical protein
MPMNLETTIVLIGRKQSYFKKKYWIETCSQYNVQTLHIPLFFKYKNKGNPKLRMSNDCQHKFHSVMHTFQNN